MSEPTPAGLPPAAPNRRRSIIIAAVAAVVLLAAAVAVVVSSGGGQTSAGDAAEASPSPTPTPTPTELTAEQAAEQEVADVAQWYYDTTSLLYLDEEQPVELLAEHTFGEFMLSQMKGHAEFRNAGHYVDSGGFLVHGIDVTAVDLAADPPTAQAEVCESADAAGFEAGSAFQLDPAERSLDVLRFEYDEPNTRWLLVGLDVTDRAC